MKRLLIMFAVTLFGLLAISDTSAQHFTTQAQFWNSVNNSTRTGAQSQWMKNQPVDYCISFTTGQSSTFASAAIGALSAWDSNVDIIDGGDDLQYEANCHADGDGILLTDAGTHCSGKVACLSTNYVYDGIHGGYYEKKMFIYINDEDYNFTLAGAKYAFAHELGKVFGLEVQYDDAGGSGACVGQNISVMNAPYIQGITVYGGCTADLPTPVDFNIAENFYDLDTWRHYDADAWHTIGPNWSWDFKDGSPAELLYYANREYINIYSGLADPCGGLSGSCGQGYVPIFSNTARGDWWGPTTMGTFGADRPAGYEHEQWRTCVYAANVKNQLVLPKVCTNWVYIAPGW